MKNNKKIYALILAIVLMFAFTTVAFASGAGNIGQNALDYVKEQAVPLCIIGIIIGIVGFAIKRNWMGAITTFVGGGFATYLIANPQKIVEIGAFFGAKFL